MKHTHTHTDRQTREREIETHVSDALIFAQEIPFCFTTTMLTFTVDVNIKKLTLSRS